MWTQEVRPIQTAIFTKFSKCWLNVILGSFWQTILLACRKNANPRNVVKGLFQTLDQIIHIIQMLQGSG